jgi:hypothetical protein
MSSAQGQGAERKASGAAERAPARDIAGAKYQVQGNRSYQAFLARLQAAVRADDRRAVMRLIAFPLRVNSQEGARFYADPRSVEQDFDRIFTPRVRQAIVNQKPSQLFVRDQGAMIGNGEVWFDLVCRSAQCSPAAPVRIRAINP